MLGSVGRRGAGRGLLVLAVSAVVASAGGGVGWASQAEGAGQQITAAAVAAGPTRGAGPADIRVQAAVDVPVHAQQWALARVPFERAWAVTRGRGVVVAVLDTGVDASRPELRGRVLAGATFTGAGFVHRRGQRDVAGHGTHVAGIIAAQPVTAAEVSGGAPEVSILPVKVLADDGSGWGSDVAAGLVWAVDHGARIANMSFGSPSPSEALRSAVLYAQQRGVLLVAAAGNDGPDGPWTYPAAYPGVLAVGAVDPGDAAAPFSTSGPFVGISAPGESVLSTVPRSVAAAGQARMSGTSMAAPYAAAAAALVLAADPAKSGAQVAARLEQTAEDLGAPGPDQVFGAGLIDPAAALGLAPATPPVRLPAPTGLVVHELTDRTVRLSWDPVPGAVSYQVLAQGLPLNLGVEDGQDPVYGLHGTSAHFPSFPHGLPVQLQVVAVDGRGLWSPASATLQALVLVSPVPAPTGVHATSPRSRTVVVRWLPARVPGVTGYLILRNGVTYDFVGPQASRFVDASATEYDPPVDGRPYTYRILTQTADAQSDPSAAVVVRPYAPWATSPPSLTTGRTDRAVRVSWSRPVPSQSGWRVFLDGVLLRQLPVGATHVDIARPGAHRVSVARFRTGSDEGPLATTTIRQ